MKYNQPYGVSDPNAPYINGNPTTGTMGSIPPAASIENPQREIVNLIADAGLTPADTDLHQLARGVQSGHLTYAADAGTTNAYAITLAPPLLTYAAGQRWAIKIANTNTGPSTLNINGLGARQIIYPSGGALVGSEMVAGAVITLIDDGAALQLQNVAANVLSAPKTYYCNSVTGDDSLHDGTTATISGIHGPFKTVNRALKQAWTWNQNGFGISIVLADGTYDPFQLTSPPNGAGSIAIVGNQTSPASCTIHSTSGEAITVFSSGYHLSGLRVQTDAPGVYPHNGTGVRVVGSTLSVSSFEFGACVTCHVESGGASSVGFYGSANGLPSEYYNVSGDSPIHISCGTNSVVNFNGCNLNTIGARSIGVWARSSGLAIIQGAYSSQTLGGAVTGQKFDVSGNAVIDTGGQPVSYFPGTIAGVSSTGGQYK
jgi:hypothetical protein